MTILGETKDGFLLEASEEEINGILKATGVKDPEPKVGDIIAVANYIEAERTAKKFVDSYPVRELKSKIDKFLSRWQKIERVLEENDK